jgi:malonate transporter and related proteins
MARAAMQDGRGLMQAIAILWNPILPVFAIMAFGFAVGRAGRWSVEDARLINRFAMTIFLPIMVFDIVASAPVHTISPAPVALYSAVQIVVFLAGFLLAYRLFGREVREAVLLAFCGVFANNAFYVLPISVLIYGESGVLPITAVIALDASVTFAGTMMALQLIEAGRITPVTILRSISRSPILIAIVLGAIFALADVALPRPVQTFIDFNGAAAAPVALFALGVVLSRTAFRLDRTVAAFTAIKLLIFPAAIWAAFSGLIGQGGDMDQFVLASAGPAGAMGLSLALLHGVRTDAIAQVMLWTSLLTLFTLAILA